MQIRRLNALRGLAALIVVVSHYSNESGLWDGLLGRGAGQIGVQLFFLLSAFLKAALYWHREPSRENLKAYAGARIARVVPLFVLVVLSSYALVRLQVPVLKDAAYFIFNERLLLTHLLTLTGYGVMWTIPAELHFYLLFGVLWWLRPRLRWAGHAVAVTVLAIFMAGFWPAAPTPVVAGADIELNIVRAAPYFMAGFLLGVHFRPKPVSAWTGLALLIPLALYPAILAALTGVTLDHWRSPFQLLALTASFAAFAYLVPDGAKAFDNRIGDWLGKVSYSLYLLHYPLLLTLKHYALTQGLGGLVLFVSLSLALAGLSYRVVELPAKEWLRSRNRYSPALVRAP